ncbi:MAG TPA: 30S ribosome-binding factor RbfA [Polyangiaceae bacterium]|nr:30S ribosome-binding factor RbfA [Polyangiaceae bacterium]
MSDARRPRRVAEQLRLHLTNALTREIADPRLSSLVVTGVDVPPDLSFARITVRLMVGDDEPERRKAAVSTLQRAARRLRSSLAPKLGLRRVPELRFEYDAGHDATRRVEEILAEIAREPTGSK